MICFHEYNECRSNDKIKVYQETAGYMSRVNESLPNAYLRWAFRCMLRE